jgi:hypothetical protein
MHPFRLLGQLPAANRAGGMTPIPLALFGLDSNVCPLQNAVHEAASSQGFLFRGSGREAALFWNYPSQLAQIVAQIFSRDVFPFGKGVSHPSPFGVIPPEGFIHLGTSDMNPVGLAVQTDVGIASIYGCAGVVSMHGLCEHLFREGFECPHLKSRMRQLAMSRIPATQYRRAEDEVTFI